MEALETQTKAETLEDESIINEESRDSGSSCPNAILSGSEAPGAEAEENGGSGSLNGNDSVDVVVAKARDVETEISVSNDVIRCVEEDISVAEAALVDVHGSSGGMGGYVVEVFSLVGEGVTDETQMTELPHENGNNAVRVDALVIDENEKSEVANESVGEGLKEDDGSMLNGGNSDGKIEVLGLNEDDKNGVENIFVGEEMKADGAFELNGSDSTTKIEFSGNDISLVVEVHGFSTGAIQDSGSEVVVAACMENPNSATEVSERSNVGQISVFEEQVVLLPENEGKSGTGVKEMSEKTKNGTIKDGKGVEEEEDDIGGQEHEFSVGDFVWGKMKSRPWWPGQIYDPSNASKNAAKYHRRDRLLVAFFGDGSFAWCYPAQLKLFQVNFDRMSKQSNSTGFLNAVNEALGEIRRQLEVEMTCSCAPMETRTALARPLTVNAGIKGGVAVPETWVSELSITQYEPAEILARLRYIVQDVSVASMLELTLLQSWLSSFYRAKGYSRLPMYHEPKGITGPEDNAGNVIRSKVDFDGPTEDPTRNLPEEDWLSLPMRPEFGKTLAEKWPGISQDKLYQRKKKRSMTELLASASRKRKKNKGFDVGTNCGLAEDGSGGSKSSSLSKKRKKIKLSGSPSSIEENKYFSVKNNDIEAEEGSKTSSLSRERKKSKYLSPPYTTLGRGYKSLISSEASDSKSSKVLKTSCAGECVSRATGQRTGSHPMVRCSSKTMRKKPSEGTHNMSRSLIPRTPKEYQKKNVLEESSVSAKKILSEFQSAALDPMYLKESESSETIKGFFAKFRSSQYGIGSNDNLSNTNMAGRPGGKKKSLDTKLGSPGKGTQETFNPTSEGKSEEKNRKRKEEATFLSSKSNSELAAGGSANVKIVNKGEAKEEKDLHETAHPVSAGKLELKKGKRKKEAIHKEEANGEKDGHKIYQPTSEGISEPKKIKRKREAVTPSLKSKSELAAGTAIVKINHIEKANGETSSKSELAAGTAIVKANHIEEANGETSAAALILTFAPGVPLPSKEDLITVFGRFGALNKIETEVLKDSGCALVTYTRISDAEDAYNSSKKKSPLGPAMVSYRLRYLSSTSRTSERDNNSLQCHPKPMQVEGGSTTANRSALLSPTGEAPPLLFIKQNLEMMTSMLESSGDTLSPNEKANLEGGIKGLLKKL